MRLKKYTEFVNEELREDEFNNILDKINKSGIESLTDKEKKELDEFNGEFDNSPQDEVEFDEEGDLRVNGKRYNPYGIPDDLYDGDEKTMSDYKPTELDPDLIKYLDQYLNDNFSKKRIDGAQKEQIFDKDGNMLRPEEVIRSTIWEMEIADIRGAREYIKNWIG